MEASLKQTIVAGLVEPEAEQPDEPDSDKEDKGKEDGGS